MTSTEKVNWYCSRILTTVTLLLKETLVPSKSAQVCYSQTVVSAIQSSLCHQLEKNLLVLRRKIIEELNNLLNGSSYMFI